MQKRPYDAPATYFASPHRLDDVDIESLKKHLTEVPFLESILEAIADIAFVLSETRQVVGANSATRKVALSLTGEEPYGKRPGEMIGCVHTSDGPAGCGTSPACKYCGALSSVLEAFEKEAPVEKESLLSLQIASRPSSLEVSARTSVLQIGKKRFALVVLSDLSAQKRKEALERIFLHDVLNVTGGIVGLSQLLCETHDDPLIRDVQRLANTLAMEIRGQQTLLEAENGKLVVEKKRTDLAELFEEIRTIFSSHAASEKKALKIPVLPAVAAVWTDRDLLFRVLVNMVKNAFEAISADEAVTLCFNPDRGGGCFEVHNPGAIPEEVAAQIFTRSFTTKTECGHGLGTYSMKLLGEGYLKGEVTFDTDPERGTVFRLVLPTSSSVED